MIVIGVAAVATLMVLEIPFAPWIRSFGLWPTLPGQWVGTLERPDGRLSFVYLDISGAMRRHGPAIWGNARWCDESGRVWNYQISGRTDNWRGTRFHLSTRSNVERPSGESPAELRAAWTGDAIRATGTMVTHGGTATATATRTSPPAPTSEVRFVLRRGSEERFTAACRSRP